MWKQMLALAREFRQRFYEFTSIHVYGIPIDKVLHFTIGGLIFAMAAKFWSNRMACWTLAVCIIAKEIVDLFLKSSIQYIHAPTSSRLFDAIGDIIFGVLGGMAAWLWQKWHS